MKLIYLKSTEKLNSFDVSVGVKITFFRVSITIDPGRSLLTIRYHKPFDYHPFLFSLVCCPYEIFMHFS